MNRSPLSPGIPFQGSTTHNATYKPFKVGGNPMFETADVRYNFSGMIFLNYFQGI